MDKLEKLYQEFWKDEYDKKGIHNPAKFEYVQLFMYRSKEFGFIKWLIDNDKVDLEKANNIDYSPLFDFYYDRDALIMALSINDEPLKFLESILK